MQQCLFSHHSLEIKLLRKKEETIYQKYTGKLVKENSMNIHAIDLPHSFWPALLQYKVIKRSGRISFTIKHSFCHHIILISLHRLCLPVNPNVLFTQLSQFSRVLRKSLFWVCFKSIQVIERCSPWNISLSTKCCLTICYRRPVQAEGMSGQCLGIYKFRRVYPFLVTALIAVVKTF